MRLPLILTLSALVSGCASVWPIASPSALCEGTANDRDDLMSSLLVDGGDQSAVAGERLLAKLDAGCGVRSGPYPDD